MMKLTKKEAELIYSIVNCFQVNSFSRFKDNVEILKQFDRNVKGSRINDWFDESIREYDEIQTIKAKMYDIITNSGNEDDN